MNNQIKQGDVFKMCGHSAFSDAAVLEISEDGNFATLARPYLYASEIGNHPLIGYETIAMVPVSSLGHYYPLVDTGRIL
jgi:hypothetical protein